MSTRSNRNPIYERPEGSGYYYIRFMDSTGKIRRERCSWRKLADAGIKVASSKLAEPGRELATKLLNIRRASADRKERMAALHGRALTYTNLREGLLASFREKANRTLRCREDGVEVLGGIQALDRFFISNTPAAVIGTDVARAFARKQLAAGFSRGTVNRSLACLRRMLKIAHEDGKLATIPIIRLLKEPPARTGFVTQKQFDELLRAMPAHLRTLIQFLYWCGCRLGEARAIEWPQVDLRRRLIRLEASQTKNGTVRDIPLPGVVIEELRHIKPKTGKVFDDRNLRKEWARACTAVGLGKMEEQESEGYEWQSYSGLIVHDLRRSAIRNMVAAGNPENWCMAISGHKTASVFRRYAIVSTQDVLTAMQRVEIYTDTNTDTKLQKAETESIESKQPVMIQ